MELALLGVDPHWKWPTLHSSFPPQPPSHFGESRVRCRARGVENLGKIHPCPGPLSLTHTHQARVGQGHTQAHGADPSGPFWKFLTHLERTARLHGGHV